MNLVSPGRILIKEGLVTQVGRSDGALLRVYLFLFNDAMMTSKQSAPQKRIDETHKYEYLAHLELKTYVMEDLDSIEMKRLKIDPEKKELYFKLVNIYTRKIYVWKADNLMEAKLWIQQISQAISVIQAQQLG